MPKRKPSTAERTSERSAVARCRTGSSASSTLCWQTIRVARSAVGERCGERRGPSGGKARAHTAADGQVAKRARRLPQHLQGGGGGWARGEGENRGENLGSSSGGKQPRGENPRRSPGHFPS